MAKYHLGKDGKYYAYPTSREEAKRLRTPLYFTGEPCPACIRRGESAMTARRRYTITDKCHPCATADARDFFNIAVNATSIARNPTRVLGFGRYGRDREISEADAQLWEAKLKELQVYSGRAPASAAESIRTDLELYVQPEACRTRGHLGILTPMKKCSECEDRKASGSPRQQALIARKAWYLPVEPCVRCGQIAERSVSNGRCRSCVPDKVHSPRQAAIAAGQSWYTPVEPCKRCGQTAERSVSNGQCRGCRGAETTSPRQQAMRDGENWYTPTTPCKYCGQIAERHVRNGQCRGCKPVSAPRTDPTLGLPDTTVLSRQDAKTLGMKVFRTGRTCRYGHTGWRYVSTGGCRDCKRWGR